MVGIDSIARLQNKSLFDSNRWGFYAKKRPHKIREMKRRGYRKCR